VVCLLADIPLWLTRGAKKYASTDCTSKSLVMIYHDHRHKSYIVLLLTLLLNPTMQSCISVNITSQKVTLNWLGIKAPSKPLSHDIAQAISAAREICIISPTALNAHSKVVVYKTINLITYDQVHYSFGNCMHLSTWDSLSALKPGQIIWVIFCLGHLGQIHFTNLFRSDTGLDHV